MIQLFMEPPLFHYNCAYATNLFAGYGTKTTEKRQNQPHISWNKTDLKSRMDTNKSRCVEHPALAVRYICIYSRAFAVGPGSFYCLTFVLCFPAR